MPKEAHEQIEKQEDEALLERIDLTRELWMRVLGMKTVRQSTQERNDANTGFATSRGQQRGAEGL